MKITGVETTLYEYDMRRKKGDANSPGGRIRQNGLAIEVQTDEGLTGVAMGGTRARQQIHEIVDDLMVGHDPRGVRSLWKRMVDMAFKGGHNGIINEAISSIDIALWDLKAKANDEPLWKTLGGSRPRVLCYASSIDIPLSDNELHDFYTEMAGYGFTGGKLKVGLDQDADIRRLGIMSDCLRRVSRRPFLCIDSNEYWSPKQAIRYITELEQHFDITWAEEPASIRCPRRPRMSSGANCSHPSPSGRGSGRRPEPVEG